MPLACMVQRLLGLVLLKFASFHWTSLVLSHECCLFCYSLKRIVGLFTTFEKISHVVAGLAFCRRLNPGSTYLFQSVVCYPFRVVAGFAFYHSWSLH